MHPDIALVCLQLPFSWPVRRAGVRMRALLPGIGFSTPSTNAKEGQEGGRESGKEKEGPGLISRAAG